MKAPPETRTIDGLEIEVSQLCVRDARAVFVKLMNALGPALSAFASGGDTTGALGKVMSELSPEDLDFVCDKFATGSKVRVGPNMVSLAGAADTVFTGRMLTMFKWLQFSAEVNYADFLSGLKGINVLSSLQSKVPSE